MMPLTSSMHGKNSRRQAPRSSAGARAFSRVVLVAGVAAAALLGQHPAGPRPALAQGGSPVTEQPVARSAQSSLDKARAAVARGDLRTAQIEFRNAIRADPNSGMLRYLLAQVSFDLGDLDTAEKEAKAAVERRFEPAASTGLLLRTYIARARYRELLREFRLPTEPAAPGVAVQIGAARVVASLANGEIDAAKEELAALERIAPTEPETYLAASSIAAAENRRDDVAANIDKALAGNPDHPDALLRKAALQLDRNERTAALLTLDRLIARNPNMVQARLIRAEAHARVGENGKAQEDVEAALRAAPGNVTALYQKAVLQVRSHDYRGADETLTRLAPVLPNIPEGLLLQATVKRALGQIEQALDGAQRYVARRPEDPRGAKLLAVMELERNQPAAAAGVLERLVQRGLADVDVYEILSRALLGAGRAREAAEMTEKLVEAVPGNAGFMTRLAATRLASGDTAAAETAAKEALRLNPDLTAARELLIIASLARGNLDTAEAELAKVPEEQRKSELMGVAMATLQVGRLDLAGGKATFEDVVRRFPRGNGARLGLARLAARGGDAAEAQRLWTEIVKIEPTNTEALGALALQALSGGPRAAAARAAIEEAQKAAPAAPAPAMTLANVLIRGGEPEKALQLLDSQTLRDGPLQRGAALHLMRADALSALQRHAEAEAAARTAFADEPDSTLTRRALAMAQLRNGDARSAEELLQLGLRRRPADPVLQSSLVAVVNQARGLDAALAAAEALAKNRDAMPAAASLRGDLLSAADKPLEAARAYAAAYADTPSSNLAQRAALAFEAAGDRSMASSILESWLQRQPRDSAALSLLAQIDLGAGRTEAAERRLSAVVEQAPTDAVALNNLAWALTLRGGAQNLARARAMAERAYFLFPTAESADTLGWVLVQSGEPARGLPLLREAVAARRIAAQISPGTNAANDPGMAYHLAAALNATGEKAEALRTLEAALAGNAPFPERAEAERLLATLKSGR